MINSEYIAYRDHGRKCLTHLGQITRKRSQWSICPQRLVEVQKPTSKGWEGFHTLGRMGPVITQDHRDLGRDLGMLPKLNSELWLPRRSSCLRTQILSKTTAQIVGGRSRYWSTPWYLFLALPFPAGLFFYWWNPTRHQSAVNTTCGVELF